jgi:uncharacterized protein YgbK (DUF1537 family)
MSDLLLAFYGDDFTGSNDAMDSLARLGIRTILFVEPPDPERLRGFEGAQATGVAGVSRSLPTAEMDAELLPVFDRLRELDAPVFHYKVCSTFDSSPQTGSIGHAIDLGQAVFASPFVPLLVGVPELARYCVFGNLFARSGADGETYRLDRHPTMSRHPSTPMTESDLGLHLSRQTDKTIGLFDITQVAAPEDEVEARLDRLLESGPEIVLFDILSEEHLPTVGRLIWDRATREDAPLFVVGSSGVGYALTAHWGTIGLLPDLDLPSAAGEVEQLVAVSGSCSPVTARQIRRAVEQGFAEIPLEPTRLVDPEAAEGAIRCAVDEALDLVGAGRSVVLHTCSGPDDPRIQATVSGLATATPDAAGSRPSSARLLGGALGRILREVLEASGLRRAAIAGGDTSGYATRSLGVEALEVTSLFEPSMPVCRVHASGRSLDGLELVFKGGQTGSVGFFENVRRGKP